MKKQLLIGISLLICGIAHAQDRMQSYYILGGVGAHNLSTSFVNSQNSSKGGAGFQISGGYSYFFNSHWGFQLGLGVQLFNASSTLNFKDSIHNQVDTDGDAYTFYAQYENWKEKQRALLFDIPVSVLYRYKLNQKTGLLFGLGGKISFPINNSYKLNGGDIVTSGYYEAYNITMTDMPQNGFPKIVDAVNNYFEVNKSNNYNLKPAYQLLVDVGLTRKINNNINYYFGGYLNFGLNDINETSNVNICTPDGYSSTSNKFKFDYKGIQSSAQVSKVLPISFGVKFGVYFSISKNTSTEASNNEIINTTIDTDMDGVPDNIDKCPDTDKSAIGFVDKDGCPLDTDGDGVPDYLDKSPNTPKGVTVDANGNPTDSDLDGVPDYLDKCPNTPKEAIGFVDINGCPLDSDNDGIPNYLDKCPSMSGIPANNGCPEIKQEVTKKFQEALKGIQFDKAKHKIKPASFKILNDIAVLLIANPSYLVEVRGHTDNIGLARDNIVISEERAQTVVEYLVAKGVNATRMTSHGYGETLPIADNNTAEGRSLNRRVEFVVSFEK
ncbi:MAG TPA: OmpA family protein [Paludibacter sp.]|nr:OmpA family protein [Paludibacter sp.]